MTITMTMTTSSNVISSHQVRLHVVEEGASEHVAHGRALQRVTQCVLHGATAEGVFGYLPDLFDTEAERLHIVLAGDTQMEFVDDFLRTATWKGINAR
jgi:hypothetical protein